MRDSSLSACTQAVVAAEVGHIDLARHYLREAAGWTSTTSTRTPATGCTWPRSPVRCSPLWPDSGAARLRRAARFRPRLPSGIDALRFGLTVRGTLLRVEVRPDEATYSLHGDGDLRFSHWDEPLKLSGAGSATLPIPPLEKLEPPKQPAGCEPGS